MQLAPSRRPFVGGSTIGVLALLLGVALAAQAVRFVPVSFRTVGVSVLGALTPTSVAVAGAMVVVALGVIAVMTRLPDWHETSATEEEPLLPPPGAIRRPLDAGCGKYA